MKAYWIHYTSIGIGEPRKFGIIESDEAGHQNVLSPPSRVASPEDAVALLVRNGADPGEAADSVASAMRQSIAHLLVRGDVGA